MPEHYEAPVDSLLSIGKPDLQSWFDYRGKFGLQQEHTSALIRMLDDPDLQESASEDDARPSLPGRLAFCQNRV